MRLEHIPEALMPALGPIVEQISSLTPAHPRLRSTAGDYLQG